MAGRFPLATLLSQTLVAFTIEFDNEFESQMLHRTTRGGSLAGSRDAPWLVSLVMWSNCMRFVGEPGISVRDLEREARTKTNLPGMERWGYVVVEPEPAAGRTKPPRSAWVIRATTAGRKAQEVWRPLFSAIEKRWQERFGIDEFDRLSASLATLNIHFGELPECLPILGYGLFSKEKDLGQRAGAGPAERISSRLPLSALLSRALLAFAIEFERESEFSLAICANILRVLDQRGARTRDLPLLSGVSKEAIRMALGILQKTKIAGIEPDPAASRTKLVRLTSKGRVAQDAYLQLLGTIEDRWLARFGKDTMRTLRASLEHLVGEPNAKLSPLFRGLEPYPGGWRASVARPEVLPHYPTILHRGGFPDGS